MNINQQQIFYIYIQIKFGFQMILFYPYTEMLTELIFRAY